MRQLLIWVDQGFNVLTWAKADATSGFWSGFGYADETLSARAWRLRETTQNWDQFRTLVDTLFFWQKNHCQNSYNRELARKGMPKVYQTG